MSKLPRKAYKALQDKWYKKAKDSGFQDIEYGDGSIRNCRPRTITNMDPVLRQAKEEYYTMAYHFLYEHKFKSLLEQIIWEYHTEGISVRNIAKILTETKVKVIKRDAVWRIIVKLESEMKAQYLSI